MDLMERIIGIRSMQTEGNGSKMCVGGSNGTNLGKTIHANGGMRSGLAPLGINTLPQMKVVTLLSNAKRRKSSKHARKPTPCQPGCWARLQLNSCLHVRCARTIIREKRLVCGQSD